MATYGKVLVWGIAVSGAGGPGNKGTGMEDQQELTSAFRVTGVEAQSRCVCEQETKYSGVPSIAVTV